MTTGNATNASQPLNSWGHPDKYYSVLEFNKEGPAKASIRDIEKILKARDPEIPQKVERTFRQWNLIIRDYLRNETGLRLSVGDDTRSIPVRVQGGFPKPFEDLISGSNVWLMTILLNRPSIINTAKGMDFFDREFSNLLSKEFIDPDMITHQEIKRVKDFVRYVALEAEKLALLNQIQNIEDDILGAYFFNIPVVHLYWMVIGAMAAILDVSVESLTVVVSIHELAHAYSHLGRDIDGGRWATRFFANTDLRIVEGIAQFYTKVTCDKLSNRIPGALEAYTKLMELQPEPYRVHNEWIENTKAVGEVVRATMIECRCNNKVNYKDFQDIMIKNRNIIRNDGGI